MDGKASLKGAWLSDVNHLNFGGNNHTLERLIVSGAVNHKLLTVGGDVDHTHRLDLYSAALGRVEEMVFTARRSYASAVLGVVILTV